MRILDLVSSGKNYRHRWPTDDTIYPHWVDYRVAVPNAEFVVRVGVGTIEAYGRPRKRVILWRGTETLAEFVGADDFEQTGDVLSVIKIPSEEGPGERNCRYPEEALPVRYAAFSVLGVPTRISGPRTPNAWAVVANVGDHRVLCALAVSRWLERQ